MKKVLLVNRKTCSNIGDQAISLQFENFIKENFDVQVKSVDYTSTLSKPDVLNVELSGYKRQGKKMIKKLLPLNFIWVLRNLSRIIGEVRSFRPSLIIIGGGQLLLPNRFLVAAITWVLISKFHGVPIVFSNIGLGGNWSVIKDKILNLVVRNCDGVNLRDIESYKNLYKMTNEKSKLILSSDIVFTGYSSISNNDDVKTKNTEKGKSRTLLGVIDMEVYNQYNNKITRHEYYMLWLDFLKSSNVNIQDCTLFYTTKEDYLESKMFSSFCSQHFGIHIDLLDYATLDEYIEILDDYDLVVSGRMHALILALNKNMDVHVFPVSQKLTVFKEQIANNSILELSRTATIKTREFLNDFV